MEDKAAQLRRDWETFAQEDPLWAILRADGTRGGRWVEDDFFATGRDEIDVAMTALDRTVPELRHGVALDFGCGVGRLSQALAEHFDQVVGVDISTTMVDMARALNRHGDTCRYEVNERTDLSLLEPASVDLIYSDLVLQHIPAEMVRGYVREFGRVLRPGGAAMFTMPSYPARTWRGLLYRIAPWAVHSLLRKRDGAVMQMHWISQAEMTGLLESADCTPAEVAPARSAGENWHALRYIAVRN